VASPHGQANTFSSRKPNNTAGRRGDGGGETRAQRHSISKPADRSSGGDARDINSAERAEFNGSRCRTTRAEITVDRGTRTPRTWERGRQAQPSRPDHGKCARAMIPRCCKQNLQKGTLGDSWS